MGEGGRRAALRRPSGLEPHGVRDYVEGEPLRAVHWPTSARRGELMVRELGRSARQRRVLLDVEAEAVAGPAGGSSLDEAVRVAAGLGARARGALTPCVLVIGAPTPQVHRVSGLARDVGGRARRPRGRGARSRHAAAAASSRARGVLAHVPELVVVTARPEAVADALVARRAVGRSSALVVDAPTYAGRRAVRRLADAAPARRGVPLAVVRQGDRSPRRSQGFGCGMSVSALRPAVAAVPAVGVVILAWTMLEERSRGGEFAAPRRSRSCLPWPATVAGAPS